MTVIAEQLGGPATEPVGRSRWRRCGRATGSPARRRRTCARPPGRGSARCRSLANRRGARRRGPRGRADRARRRGLPDLAQAGDRCSWAQSGRRRQRRRGRAGQPQGPSPARVARRIWCWTACRWRPRRWARPLGVRLRARVGAGQRPPRARRAHRPGAGRDRDGGGVVHLRAGDRRRRGDRGCASGAPRCAGSGGAQGSSRPADARPERRDAGPPGADRPTRRRLVPRGRHGRSSRAPSWPP